MFGPSQVIRGSVQQKVSPYSILMTSREEDLREGARWGEQLGIKVTRATQL